MRPCSSGLALWLLLPTLAFAQSTPKYTPAQLRELEREARLLSEKAKKFAAEQAKETKGQKKGKGKDDKDKKKEEEPKPANCKLTGARRAAQFSEEALP